MAATRVLVDLLVDDELRGAELEIGQFRFDRLAQRLRRLAARRAQRPRRLAIGLARRRLHPPRASPALPRRSAAWRARRGTWRAPRQAHRQSRDACAPRRAARTAAPRPARVRPDRTPSRASALRCASDVWSSALSAVSSASISGWNTLAPLSALRISRRIRPASAGAGAVGPLRISSASRTSSADFSSCISRCRRSASVVFLAGLGRELGQFVDDVPGIILARRRLGDHAPAAPRRAASTSTSGRMRVDEPRRPASSSPPKASSSARCVAASTSARSSCWPWISTSLAPIALQQPGADRLVVDERSRPAIGVLHAAQDQIGVVGDFVLAQRDARRMIGRQLQHGDHLPAVGARAAPARRRRARQAPGVSASSRIDLPAPVSPVSAVSPSSRPRSSWSISTMLRTESALSTRRDRALSIEDVATPARADREQNSNELTVLASPGARSRAGSPC